MKKGLASAIIIVATSLVLTGIYSWARITAVEEQVKNLRGWIEDTRVAVDRNRTENNSAHYKIQADIKDQGKTVEGKLDEILRGMKK